MADKVGASGRHCGALRDFRFSPCQVPFSREQPMDCAYLIR